MGFRLSLLLLAILGSAHASAKVHRILIEDHVFVPDEITIAVGDTVEWFANAPEHTITADSGEFDSTKVADTIPYQETYTVDFPDVGTFRYFCGIHGGPNGSGMSGLILVTAATQNRPPPRPINVSPANGAKDLPLNPTLDGSVFSDPDSDIHTASQWMVRRAANGQTVFDSGEDSANKIARMVPVGLLLSDTVYTWQVRYKDGRGLWSEYSPATSFTTLKPVIEVGIGLSAWYANSVEFLLPLAATTNSVLDFSWGTARPHRRITADAFGARWEGALLPEFTESYAIEFQYRGRARVWVKGQLVIDRWEECSFGQTRRAFVDLVGGQLAPIKVEYGAAPQGAQAILRWASPSVALEVIPTAKLFPASL